MVAVRLPGAYKWLLCVTVRAVSRAKTNWLLLFREMTTGLFWELYGTHKAERLGVAVAMWQLYEEGAQFGSRSGHWLSWWVPRTFSSTSRTMPGGLPSFRSSIIPCVDHCAWKGYLLTPWSRVLLEKLTGSQLVKKFLAFYGTRSFIIAFTSARHQSLSWASSIQSKPPYRISWRSILTLSSHLRMGLPRGLFPSSIPTKTLYTPVLSPYMLHAPLISFFLILSPEQYLVSSTDD